MPVKEIGREPGKELGARLGAGLTQVVSGSSEKAGESLELWVVSGVGFSKPLEV